VRCQDAEYGIEADWRRWIDRFGKRLPMPEEDVAVQRQRAKAEGARANAKAARAAPPRRGDGRAEAATRGKIAQASALHGPRARFWGMAKLDDRPGDD
jgi:hypothetical protein